MSLTQNTGRILSSVAALAFFASVTAMAQHERFDELAEQGEDALNAGNYKRAIECFEEIVAKGKTYSAFFEIKFDLGWAYYLTERYKEAIPIFVDLSGKRSPSPEMKEQSLFLLAECHARYAGLLDPENPETKAERKKNLDTAIELQTKFQKEYPESRNIAESLYGRAYAYYLSNDYEKAEEDLMTVINRHRLSPSVTDAKYLLASVYAKQGLTLHKEKKEEAARDKLKQARQIFESLAKDVTSPSIANDSAFSTAETWFSAGYYDEAIRYFRKVVPKKYVKRILAGQAKAVQEQLIKAIHDKTDQKPIKKELNKLKAQYNAVDEGNDLMVSAYFRIADCYHKLDKFDECRIVSRHLMNFLQGDQKKQAALLILNTYLQQKDAENAEIECESFMQMFGTDHPELKPMLIGTGQLFLLQNNTEKATRLFDIATQIEVSEDANPQTEEDAHFMKFSSLYYDGKYEDCLAAADAYIARDEKGIYVPNAIYFKAVSYAGLKNWEEAMANIDKLLTEYPDGTEEFTQLEEAYYQKGWILVESEKYQEAADQFQAMLDRFEDGTLRAEAMFQQGIALQKLKKREEANEVLRKVAKEHPENKVAPYALYQIAVDYFQDQDWEKMSAALTELVTAFPDNPIVTDAYYFIGFCAQQQNNYDEAIEAFRKSLASNPEHDRAPQCLIDIANNLKSKAGAMGVVAIMPDEKKQQYKDDLLNSAKTYEQLLDEYPASAQALKAVSGIADVLQKLVDSKQMTEEEADKYFADAIAKHPDNKELQAQLQFSKGSFLMGLDKEDKALAMFKTALKTDPNVRLSPELLCDYARALIKSGDLDEAESVCNKVLSDYMDDERAIAPATFLLAEVKFNKKDFENARQLYEGVLEDYPWFEEGAQGRVKLAEIYEINGDLERAEEMFTDVFGTSKGNARVAALLAVGRCQTKRAQLAPKGSAEYKNNLKTADVNLKKLIVLYPAFKEYASEGYYWAGIVYELNNDPQNAANMFGDLVSKYSESDWVPKAKEHLKEIGKKGIVPQTEAQRSAAAKAASGQPAQ